MLVELPIGIGDVVAASKMIGMVEVEILLKRGVALGVGTRGVLLDEFRDDSTRSGIDVLCSSRTRPLGVELVDIDGFTLGTAFDGSIALVVVFVGLGMALIGDALDAVFFVPDNGPVGAVGVLGPTGLIAVGIVGIGSVTDVDRGMGSDRRRSREAVLVAEVIARLLLGDGDGGRLHDRVELMLGDDVVDAVIGHVHAVGMGLGRRRFERSFRMGEAIEFVVDEGLVGRTAVT